MTAFRNKRGFTLVEILVAMLVAGILINAVYQVMVHQTRVYTVEERQIEMQQNARAALDFMARELRMAGFGVPDDDVSSTNVFIDLINNAPEQTEMIDPGTDAVIFTAGVGSGSWVAEAVNPGDETYSVKIYPATDGCFEFETGTKTSPTFVDLIAHEGNEKCKLNEEPLKITRVTGPTDNQALTTVTFEKRIADVLIDDAKGKGLVEGDQVVLCPQIIRYSIHEKILKRSLSRNGGESFFTVQSLINNVDDLQLAYSFDDSDDDHKADMDHPVTEPGHLPRVIRAVDAGATGFLNTKVLSRGKTAALKLVAYRSNGTGSNAHSKTGNPSHNPLRGVTLSLVVRSSRQNPDHRFRRSFEPLSVQDHDPAGNSKDGFRRRQFEWNIPFRNLGLNPFFTDSDEFED